MAIAVKSVQDEVVPALERLDILSSVRTVASAKTSRIAWVIKIRWNWNVTVCNARLGGKGKIGEGRAKTLQGRSVEGSEQ